MKIAHLTDIHYNGKEDSLQALDYIADMLAGDVDLIAITGDLFDAGLQNSDRDGFPLLIEWMSDLMETAPIVAITGTPTHDRPGCYEVFKSLPGQFLLKDNKTDPVFYSSRYERFTTENDVHDPESLMILGCGEPQKSWFLAGKEGIGKDEAAAEVSEGMKSMLFGMAAKRREYPDNPCLFLYHGIVEGSETWYSGNPGSEIRINPDDLAAIGADYYALGHIHKRHQIPSLPEAWYGGSAYPVDWGETDQKRFNIVTLDGPRATTIEYETFPFPPRKKIVRDINQPIGAEEIAGHQVWVVEKVPAGVGFNKKNTEEFVETHAEPGSRVSVEIVPVETARAEKIRTMQRLRDKVALWAEASELDLKPGVFEKADELEREMMKSGDGRADGAIIQIDKLKLTGAIGIWKGTGRDDIEIDFESLSPGVIAIMGKNGAGKTTLLENMHPYPQLLTREGKLQDHFRLSKSARDLHFTDLRTDDKYRALILINGAAASGSCEYHLYKNGEPITDGRQADYSAKIDELCGPIELYLRSAFVMQKATKNTPEISQATNKEKKELFSALAGIDYLEGYALFANEGAKSWEAKAEETQTKKAVAHGKIEDEEELHGVKQKIEDQIKTYIELIELRQTEKVDVEHTRAELIEKKDEQDRNHRRRQELAKSFEEKRDRKEQLRIRAENLKYLIDDEDDIRKEVEKYAEFQKKQEALIQEEVAFHQEQAARMQKLATERQAVAEEDAGLEQRAAQVLSAISELRISEAKLDQRIAYLNEKLSHKITCPSCNHQFSAGGVETQALLVTARRDKKNSVEMIAARETTLKELQQKRSGLEWPDPPNQDAWPRRAELNQVLSIVRAIAIDELTRKLDEAKTAKAERGSIIETMADIHGEMNEISTEIADLPLPDPRLVPNLEATESDLRKINDELEKYRTDRDVQEGELRQIDRRLINIDEAKAEIFELERLWKEQIDNAVEWRTLADACGRDGIQALELDALAPSITEAANEILTEAYGPRFTIEIRTQRVSGSGSRSKMIEAFDIIVHDAETGTEQGYDTLSGGEAVWVRKAIYDAFGIIGSQNTGRTFLTVFLDEADGALHAGAKAPYIRLIRAAHELAKRTHTVLITHSKELQEMIAEHIELS